MNENFLVRSAKKWIQRWDAFWFDPVSLYNLAVFRFVFCMTMALMYVARQPDVGLFYSDEGILPKSLSLKVLADGFRPAFTLSFWPDSFVPWAHAALILLLILMAFGVIGRFFALIAVYLQLAFLFRNYGVAFGADQIGTIFLLYLALTQSSARLSVMSWWREKKKKPQATGDLLTNVFYRMIQIQLCIIYVYSGMEKLKGMSWWDGTAVWSVMANSQMVIADFTWLRHFPMAIVFVSFSTILFELYFPVLVWVPQLRKYLLGAGALFHAGIGVIMALWSFAIIMLSSYVLFIPERWTLKALDRLRLKLRQK